MLWALNALTVNGINQVFHLRRRMSTVLLLSCTREYEDIEKSGRDTARCFSCQLTTIQIQGYLLVTYRLMVAACPASHEKR